MHHITTYGALALTTETQVIETHRGYVEGLAHKLKRQLKIRVEVDDLMAYGFEGLLQAWRRYDPESKASFTSFAYYRVRGSMLDGCRKEGWAPRKRESKAKKMQALNANLEHAHATNHDKPPAKTLSQSIDRVADTVGSALTILFIEQDEMASMVVTQPEQEKNLELLGKRRRLTDAMDKLEEKERTIIARHHFQEHSLTDIARDLNLSTSWCSRIHARALLKMRDALSQTG